jgi:hypothetical protein
MKEYVKIPTTLREKLLFLFTGLISKDSIEGKEPEIYGKYGHPSPPKRKPGESYTHYPTAGVEPDKPWPRCPEPPPIRVIREGVSCDGKLDIPFFELDTSEIKSNL